MTFPFSSIEAGNSVGNGPLPTLLLYALSTPITTFKACAGRAAPQSVPETTGCELVTIG